MLPIGGLKEKLLAAYRAGLTMVLIPKENQKDLEDVPANVLAKIAIVAVEYVDEALASALTLPLPSNKPDEVDMPDLLVHTGVATPITYRQGL